MRNPIMVGERVYLRPLEVDDADGLATMDAVETDTFMWRGPMPTSPLRHAQWIEKLYEDWPPRDIVFAVCTVDDDRFLGLVGIYRVDWVNRVGETGSFLGPAEVRTKGHGTEAKHLLLEYCFDRLHLHVLQSFVLETNTRSSAALAKQGYRPAGRAKWADVKNGRFVDALVYDVKRAEWLAAREAWRKSRSTAS